MRTPGNLRGGGPAVDDVPMDEVGISEHVSEESGAGTITGPTAGLGDYVKVLNFQEVARLRSLDRRLGRLGGVPPWHLDRPDLRRSCQAGSGSRTRRGFRGRPSSPGSTSTMGGTSGCQRLWPNWGSSLRPLGAVDGDGLHWVPSDV